MRAIDENNGVVQCVALASFLKSNKPKDEAVQKLREELGLTRNSTIELTEEQRTANWNKLREARNELNKIYPQANVSDYVDHIEHIIKVAGIDHVGIGFDFDGGGGITGWSDASQSRNVTRELLFRGYTEEDVQKIWSGNLLRVLRDVEKVAAASK